MRLDRWRERHPKYAEKPLDDERRITHDSDYYIDGNGVAHTTHHPRGAA
jgi:hypothetical protein